MVTANADAERGGIRARRLAAGLSQERLARLADCSLSTIRLAECAWTPSEEMIGRIAVALQCDTADLVVTTSGADR